MCLIILFDKIVIIWRYKNEDRKEIRDNFYVVYNTIKI